MTPPATLRSRESFALWALIAVYVVTYCAIGFIKYAYFLYDDIDLAIFAQACSRLMHGSLFSSIRGMNVLGDHSSLVLFLVAPLYAPFRDPRALLVVQTIAIALGAVPVAALARRELGDRTAALGCAALYLLYPAVGYVNLFEFHPEALSTAPLLAAFYYVRCGRLRPAALFAALALLGKEDVALVVLGLALYAWFQPHAERVKLAATLAGLAIVSLVVSFAILKPMLGGTEAEYGRMYATWGATTGQAIAGMATHPLRAIATVFSTPGDPVDTELKAQYFLHLLLPLAFLPLLSPAALLIALPVVAEHMLSSRSQQHSILYQYTALVMPFTIAATVLGVRALSRWIAPGKLVGLALVASVACNVMFGPLLGHGVLQARRALQRNLPTAEDRERAREMRTLLARVPKSGGVVAGFGLLPALSARDNVHSLHHIVSGHYTYSTRPYPVPTGIDAVIGDLADERLMAYVDFGTSGRLESLLATNQLAPVNAFGDRVLYLRGSPAIRLCFPLPLGLPSGEPNLRFDSQLALRGFEREQDSIAAGSLAPLVTYWETLRPPDRLFVTQWLLFDRGGVKFSRLHYLGYLDSPPHTWKGPIREEYRLPIPESLPPGSYVLAMRVGWRQHGQLQLSEVSDPSAVGVQGMVPLGTITITAPARGAAR